MAEQKDLDYLRLQNEKLEIELDNIELKKKLKSLGVGVQSKAPEQRQQSNLEGNSGNFEQFRADFIQQMQASGKTEYKGRDYLQILNDLRMKRI